MTKEIAFYSFHNLITALEHYRVYGPLDCAGINIINGIDHGKVNLDIIKDCNFVLFQRDFASHFHVYQAVVDQARKLKKPVILDLDDDLLTLPPDHPDRINHYYTDGLLAILHAIINVDAVTVTTLLLKEKLQKLNPNVWVLPNYLDRRLWKMRTSTFEYSENPLTILYVGSPSHRPDLDMISIPLTRLAKTFKDRIRFHFIGIEPPIGLKEISQINKQPVLTHEYQEFVSIINDVQADIAIAPLCDNEFNRSKSVIKYFEYTAMGIPAVYSGIPPYSSVIRDGYDGLLALTLDEWFEKIQLLIRSADLRREIVQNAQLNIHRNWLLEDHETEWQSVYDQIKTSTRDSFIDRSRMLDSLTEIIVQSTEQKAYLYRKLIECSREIVGVANPSAAGESIDPLRIEQQNNSLDPLTSYLDRITQVFEDEKISIQVEIDRLHEKLVLLNSKLEEIEKSSEEERVSLQTERDSLLRQSVMLQAELLRARCEIVDYTLSTSWKITRPLRKLGKKLRREL